MKAGWISWIASAVLLAGGALAQQATDLVAPENAGVGAVQVPEMLQQSAIDKAAGRSVRADNWMISAANPLAVEAGARVLQSGGSAADALVAVQAVLGLVEPQSSGAGQ